MSKKEKRRNAGSEKPQGGGRQNARPREFNLARAARDRYAFNGVLFRSSGSRITSHVQSARELAHIMNRQRDVSRHPDRVVYVSSLHAVGLIDQIYHRILMLHHGRQNDRVLNQLLDALYRSTGKEAVDTVLRELTSEFPPIDVYNRVLAVDQYLLSVENGESGREMAIEELFLLWIENQNPAFRQFNELIGDEPLHHLPVYTDIIQSTIDKFETLPPIIGRQQSLVELLLEPSRRFPNSVEEQLRFIREHWSGFLGDLLFQVLHGLDLFREDHKGFFAAPGPGESRPYRFHGQEAEIERFSKDRDWMPKLVLIAKNTLVWLHQLSNTYARDVRRLDQIPEEELDKIASWGFTGLWLIGIWERSPASRRIKQIMGNSEAEASAYSLSSYDVAGQLGGWEALEVLKVQCASRGIRLASDMVPNHTGIDSEWIMHYPERFISVSQPPFPAYTFSGENLSANPNVSIYIEDHYYDRTDASVVFKRVDNSNGDVRYVYHGNDGTHMPWNDTAQLDFLNPQTRRAVIDTILHVARTFPIVRFDAAMTLAKRHYHRLWFPEPGTGGDIPSRSEHGLTTDQFNNAMPQEFWREVVDRVAEELPDTLLLAEAFWMMEGYFVRSLGMHRVYNSAFMNMLKEEENAKYRETIKNTIEFDRNILSRFVNFMNNPDEETAIVQFGRDDKYFGICTMLVTMPGLPMFGHGQVEGFSERYGMEFRQAYLHEHPDSALIARHEREIFPLMRKRHLFADAARFLLFDLYRNDGSVNENVFAYTNGSDDERVLVLYNNAYESAWGWIRLSSAYAERDGEGRRTLVQQDLAETLRLHRDDNHFCLLYEELSGLWYIRSSADIAEQGLHVGLRGYGCQVFTRIHEEEETESGLYHILARHTAGTGVPDIETALRNIYLNPLYEQFNPVVERSNLDVLFTALERDIAQHDLDAFYGAYESFLGKAIQFGDLSGSTELVMRRLHGLAKAAAPLLRRRLPENHLHRAGVVGWLLLAPLGELSPSTTVEEWALPSRISAAVQAILIQRYQYTLDQSRYESLLRILTRYETWYKSGPHQQPARNQAIHVLRELSEDVEVTSFLGFNRFDDVVWFQKEAFEVLTRTLTMIAIVQELGEESVSEETRAAAIRHVEEIGVQFSEIEAESDYRVDRLMGNT